MLLFHFFFCFHDFNFSPICALVRLCRPDDGHQRGKRHIFSHLRCGEAAGVYWGHWRHLLVDPHDLQRLALPAQKEEKWPEQHVHRHPQGLVFLCYKLELCLTDVFMFKMQM